MGHDPTIFGSGSGCPGGHQGARHGPTPHQATSADYYFESYNHYGVHEADPAVFPFPLRFALFSMKTIETS